MAKDIRTYATAGGIVLDDAGRVLLLERDVLRDGRVVHEVRLPKGKIDPGESNEQAALREVGEESGYWEVEIIGDLGSAQIEFDKPGWRVVREDHYFLMRLTSPHRAGMKVAPDSEEALFVPLWVKDPGEAQERLTFESEKIFARRAAAWLAEED